MKKYIICNYNAAERGKTPSLLKVIEELRAFAAPNVTTLIGGIDLYAEFVIEETKIAVITQGDPDSMQDEMLKKAAMWGADIIVCAARSYGSTVDAIYQPLLSGYEKIWLRSPFFDNMVSAKEFDITATSFAKEILYEIGFLFGIKCIMSKF